MSNRDDQHPEDWGSWESNRARGQLAGLEATADERIAWVEEMLVIAIASGACPRPRDAWGQPLLVVARGE